MISDVITGWLNQCVTASPDGFASQTISSDSVEMDGLYDSF